MGDVIDLEERRRRRAARERRRAEADSERQRRAGADRAEGGSETGHAADDERGDRDPERTPST
jgi:hypothetical protein